ncbi:MAG: peptidase M28 family protein, partial [Dehalococcoidia bacterium]
MRTALVRAFIAIVATTQSFVPAAAQDRADPATSSSPDSTRLSERYAEAGARIIQATMAGNESWMMMQEICDDIGPRLSGSASLERAIEWAVDRLKKDGQENVHTEPVMVTKWVRGAESLVMLEPRRMELAMLGLGGSVGTPPGGITAAVVVVSNEEELEALGAGAEGKIVLFDNPMPPYDPEKGAGYGRTVRFRGKGPRLAAQKGAVACLV